MRHWVHQRGRMLTVSLRLGQWAHFSAIHLNPALTLTAKKLALTSLRTASDVLPGARIVLGDWNFMHLGDARATYGGREVATNDDLSRHFESEFTAYAELYQREYTFARSSRSLATSATFSRIDRVYCSLPQVDLERYCIHTGVVGQLLGQGTLSDHRAVRVVFQSTCQPPPRPRLARGVAEAVEYQRILGQVLADHSEGRPLSAWATWEVLTSTGHRAAKAARPLLATKADADPRLLAQVLLSALRLRRDGHEKKAVAMLPDIPQFVACWADDKLCTSVTHRKVQHWMEETGLRELAALERSDIPDLHKTSKRDRIRRMAAAHRLQRRRVILDGIYDADGTLVETAEKAGELLQAHWAPVFAGGQRSAHA